MTFALNERTWFLFPENPFIPPIEWVQTLRNPEKYERLLQVLMATRHATVRYTGRIDGRKIWLFHIMLTTLGQVNYLIMPPGGISIERWEENKWHVKNFHPLIVETAERNNAKLIAIVDFFRGKGGHISRIEEIERAWYTRSVVNMRHGFVVLNHGNNPHPHSELERAWFKNI